MSDKEQPPSAGELAVKNQSREIFNPQDIDAKIEVKASIFPDLAKHKASILPVAFQYYTPQKVGDVKSVFIAGVGDYPVPDRKAQGTFNIMECVVFIERIDDNTIIWWYSASVILVGTVKQGIINGTLKQLGGADITYIGKKKTKGDNQADNWIVTPYDGIQLVVN